MTPGNLFRLQLMAAFGDRRQMILRVGVSCLLSLPFVLVGMPARAQAGGIAMVILFTGFFGAAVSHAHLREDGRLARLHLLPISRWTLWPDLVLSSMLMRLGPSAVVLTGFVAVNGRNVSPAVLLNLIGLLCAALLLLTLLGIGTGRLARSNAEVHLFGALATGVLALLSGVAPLPERLLRLEAVMAWNPIAQLHGALIELATGMVVVPAIEMGLSSTILIAIMAAAILRWVSGGTREQERFDTQDVVNRTSMEVQAK
jgi:hypothetical protein